MDFDSSLPFSIFEIVWINLLLSGDNAVVIALACRSLPSGQRSRGMWLGAGAAVFLRVAFTAIVASLLGLPLLKLAGGALLIWIAVRLLLEETEETDVAAPQSLWSAVKTIVAADMVMSLDNVLAIAAAAHGSWMLIVFGLVLSAPMVVFGAEMMIGLLQKFPIFVWGGAALLGWVAGELMIADPAWSRWAGARPGEVVEFACSAAGAAIVLAAGWGLRRREGRDI